MTVTESLSGGQLLLVDTETMYEVVEDGAATGFGIFAWLNPDEGVHE